MTTYVDGLEVIGDLPERAGEVLTQPALQLVVLLHRRLGERRLDLLHERRRRVDALAGGGTLDFLPETAHVRDDAGPGAVQALVGVPVVPGVSAIRSVPRPVRMYSMRWATSARSAVRRSRTASCWSVVMPVEPGPNERPHPGEDYSIPVRHPADTAAWATT